MKERKILKIILIIIPVILSLLLLSCRSTGVSQISQEPEDAIVETEKALESEAEELIKEEVEPQETVEETEEIEEVKDVEYTGLCNNPYFPVKPDTFWNYKVQNPYDTYEYVSSFIEIANESFIEKIESKVFNADVKWLCLSDGLVLVQSEYSSLMLEEDSQGMEFTTESYEGVTIPSPDKWIIGYKWDTRYRVRTIIVEYEQMTFTGDIIIKNEIVLIESVTVPAGTFPEAFKIDSDKSTNISTDIGGTSMSFDVYTDISSWYVEDTGLVKQISKATCGTTTIELLYIEEKGI